ncbi:MAG: ribonuclease HII [Candidatus Berkelbacteria bacterium]|nr:ribonuclease HII [Candidatus Berkelbacteria bacterium]
MRKDLNPAQDIEGLIRKSGYSRLCGIDEAGRGALAGPLVAAAVILPVKFKVAVKDSKQLKNEERTALSRLIKEKSICWSIGLSSVEEINAFGIQSATYIAYHRAIDLLEKKPDFLIIDHYRLPATRIPQKSITFGDRLCPTISAASIIAKTTRDQIMQDLSRRNELKKYKLHKHFGYGTKLHLKIVAKIGPSSEHRIKYISGYPLEKIRNTLFTHN